MQNNTTHFTEAPREPIQGECALLDRSYDEWTQEEQQGLLQAFFGRVDALTPSMMK